MIKRMTKDFCTQYIEQFTVDIYPKMMQYCKEKFDSTILESWTSQPFLAFLASLNIFSTLAAMMHYDIIHDNVQDLQYMGPKQFINKCKEMENDLINCDDIQHAGLYIKSGIKGDNDSIKNSILQYGSVSCKELYNNSSSFIIRPFYNCYKFQASAISDCDAGISNNAISIQFLINNCSYHIVNGERDNHNIVIKNIPDGLDMRSLATRIISAGFLVLYNIISDDDGNNIKNLNLNDLQSKLIGMIDKYVGIVVENFWCDDRFDRMSDTIAHCITNPISIDLTKTKESTEAKEEKSNALEKMGPVIPSTDKGIAVIAPDSINKEEFIKFLNKLCGDDIKDDDSCNVIKLTKGDKNGFDDYYRAIEGVSALIIDETPYSPQDYLRFSNTIDRFLSKTDEEKDECIYQDFSFVRDPRSDIHILFGASISDEEDPILYAIANDRFTGNMEVFCITGEVINGIAQRMASGTGSVYPKYFIVCGKFGIEFCFERDIMNPNSSVEVFGLDVLYLLRTVFVYSANRYKSFYSNIKCLNDPSFSDILNALENLYLFKDNKSLENTISIFEKYCEKGLDMFKDLDRENPFINYNDCDLNITLPNSNYILHYDNGHFVKSMDRTTSIFGLTDEISIWGDVCAIKIPLFGISTKRKGEIVNDVRKVLKWIEFNNKETKDEDIDTIIARCNRKGKRNTRKSSI